MILKGKEMFKTCVAPRKESARINKELWIWFCKAQNKGKIKLTKKAVQTKARLIYQESGYKNFLASDTWYRNWRNKFLKSETSLTEIEAKHDKITLVEPSISLEVSLNFSTVMICKLPMICCLFGTEEMHVPLRWDHRAVVCGRIAWWMGGSSSPLSLLLH
jgi:hypothetical protein